MTNEAAKAHDTAAKAHDTAATAWERGNRATANAASRRAYLATEAASEAMPDELPASQEEAWEHTSIAVGVSEVADEIRDAATHRETAEHHRAAAKALRQ